MAQRRLFILPILGACAALVAVPLLTTTAAFAAPDPDRDILVFSNEDFTDPEEEDADIALELALMGDVTIFDGGDGSAAAWTTALDGQELLVLPEGTAYEVGGTSAMSDEAALVVKAWLEAGHTALGTGSYTHLELLNLLTGVDFSADWSDDVSEDGWDLQLPSDTLPASLPNADYTGGQVDFASWTPEQKAVVTPIYLAPEGNLGVGSFAVGAGEFLYYAYDWYPAQEDVDSGARAAWNEALRLGASGQFGTPMPTTPAPVPVASAPTLALELELAVGQPVAGATAQFTAVGLRDGAPFSLVLRSTPITLAQGTIPAGGAVSQEVVIPAGLSSGWHSLTFASTFADGSAANAVLWFEIDSAGLLLNTSTAAPALASTGANPLPLSIGAGVLLAAGAGILLVRRASRARA